MSTTAQLGLDVTFDEGRWVRAQVERHGPVIGGQTLRDMLGFRTVGAFRQARYAGNLGVKVFTYPYRRGHFALTCEVCAWILKQRNAGSVQEVSS